MIKMIILTIPHYRYIIQQLHQYLKYQNFYDLIDQEIMHKEHEDKIKEDEADLKNLSTHLEKVQKLKKQYTQQKQQIGSLKNVIMQLKSQNEELRSQSFVNEKSQSCEKKHKIDIFSNPGEQYFNQTGRRQQKLKNKKLKSESMHHEDDDEADPEERRTKPKMWNNGEKKNRKETRQKFLQKYNEYQDIDEQALPNMSIRNYSGYISSTYTGRLLSPQARTQQHNQGLWRGRKAINYTQYDRPEYEPKLDANYLNAKSKLIDNLVADLNFQLQEKQGQISQQQSNHKQTRKNLKKTMVENEKLSKMNHKLFSSHELLQKQNQFLKQELIKQTQGKYKAQCLNQDFILWHNTVAKRCYEQFELQFLAMDAIYYEFQRICNSRIYL